MAENNTQVHGDFMAFLVRDKEPGDQRPVFTGKLSLPGTEQDLLFPLWGNEYADPNTGAMKTMFNGAVDVVPTDADPQDQINALLATSKAEDTVSISNVELRPRQIVLFPNRFKDEAPDKKRPDYWGAFNPGNGEPVVRLSVWVRKDRNGRALLTGTTSYPTPGKSEVEQQDAAPTLAELEKSGTVTRGMSGKGKKRGGGRGE